MSILRPCFVFANSINMIFVASYQPVYHATIARVSYSVACHHRVESESPFLPKFVLLRRPNPVITIPPSQKESLLIVDLGRLALPSVSKQLPPAFPTSNR
jgi:hypothetical protein